MMAKNQLSSEREHPLLQLVLTRCRSIYFVHGLNGDRLRSFTFTQQDGTQCFWPKDLLPMALHAANPSIKCRIYSYGYNASTHTGKISLQSLLDHGAELLRTIAEEREVERVCSVILLSFGSYKFKY
jgi:hypothetical protein